MIHNDARHAQVSKKNAKTELAYALQLFCQAGRDLKKGMSMVPVQEHFGEPMQRKLMMLIHLYGIKRPVCLLDVVLFCLFCRFPDSQLIVYGSDRLHF